MVQAQPFRLQAAYAPVSNRASSRSTKKARKTGLVVYKSCLSGFA
ncbi:hypothetical protein LC2W_2341 [Lacticaseibacillus paracasei]|uniref:Uncharacterized protein n=1 Tax=Lacticaseibacillus paracasei subsp. paracasei TaxID=47714 RepID=A0AAP9HI46_LACPA|nr:hypothetical protein LCAZH_2153 [Lacticaseibacillus paracasei]AEA54672.1 hypothetical protein LC2W_2341 [Lacticaseibacillus paracasei]AEA57854.1 hypothetical protein LCBD_2359 [Lacticaseibacillus paracasei]AGP69045.1 Hypothetical protein LOCK919_2363 [Lacticaseibacillus paracasei]QGV18891.1 Hypothetical protein LCAKO_2384 [Lacticaseibacillus paracasei subsp. paracasei]